MGAYHNVDTVTSFTFVNTNFHGLRKIFCGYVDSLILFYYNASEKKYIATNIR
jgi:hypothetical protein